MCLSGMLVWSRTLSTLSEADADFSFPSMRTSRSHSSALQPRVVWKGLRPCMLVPIPGSCGTRSSSNQWSVSFHCNQWTQVLAQKDHDRLLNNPAHANSTAHIVQLVIDWSAKMVQPCCNDATDSKAAFQQAVDQEANQCTICTNQSIFDQGSCVKND